MITIYNVFCARKLKCVSFFLLNDTILLLFFKCFNAKNITIASSCEVSSIFFSYTIVVDKVSKVSLKVIIQFVDIPCSHFVTMFLYTSNKLWQINTTCDCGWWINGNHKWSENSILHYLQGLTVTKIFYYFHKCGQKFSQPFFSIFNFLLLITLFFKHGIHSVFKSKFFLKRKTFHLFYPNP